MFRRLKNLDWILIVVALFLFIIGIIVIYSTTSGTSGFTEARNQIIYGVLGFALLFSFAFLDYKVFKSFTHVLYVVMVALLLFVLISGRISHGATRWINLGFFQLQPSEVAKFVMIIVLAKYFSQKGEKMVNLSSFAISLAYTAIPVFLVLIQPDLGTALVLIAIWGGMVLASQAKKIYIFGLGLMTVVTAPIAFDFLKDYQKKRILTFLNPASDPQGAGYNVLQSTISVGSGKIFGRGLGHGPQSQLKFLPERYTDFIFSVLGEELGLLGSVVLLILFLILLFRIIRVARISSDNFGSFIAVGVAVWILFQAFVNIGMNIGIMPVTGIPLPLISYGGSSALVIMMSLGLLQSVLLRCKKLNFKG